MVEKLTDKDYWTKFEWTNKKSLEQEKKKQEQMQLIMTNFQHNLIFDKETILKNNKGEMPEEFDMDHKYLTSLMFRNKNFDADL